MNPEKLTMVCDYNGDWAGLYHKSILIEEGHVSNVIDTLIHKLGVQFKEADMAKDGRAKRSLREYEFTT